MGDVKQDIQDIQAALNAVLENIAAEVATTDEADLPSLEEVDNASNKAKLDSGK